MRICEVQGEFLHSSMITGFQHGIRLRLNHRSSMSWWFGSFSDPLHELMVSDREFSLLLC
jgi:hypothetical protein